MKPVARTDRIIKHVVGQDTLIYDAAGDTACCLNSLAALVWRHCDGEHTEEQIAAFVSAEIELPPDVDPVDVVLRVIDELEAHRLVSVPAEDGAGRASSGMGRRDVVKALALLPLFPAIQQITAPKFASVGSPAPSVTATASSPAASPSATFPGVSQSATPAASPTATPGLTPSATPTLTPTMSMTPTGSPTPSPTPSHT